MNPRTRRAALYAIGVIALLASANALAHSYAGLYDWAVHHRLGGWQAMSWPAEIDVFLAVGELALYVAYLDGWQIQQRIWPWATALTGLSVSILGNIGHIQAAPGQPVIMADRLTAATSPIAAFAGLTIGLLVLKMTRRQGVAKSTAEAARPALVLATGPVTADVPGHLAAAAGVAEQSGPVAPRQEPPGWPSVRAGLLSDASAIRAAAATRGEWLSQRSLARQLRERGHRFPNDQVHQIAEATQLAAARAA
ncbi:MAG: hypothetical protein ACRDRJ_02165 [Streptosporangiaceae bacterium]